jgi:isocitrate/isopropylmalate dehydrogenase
METVLSSGDARTPDLGGNSTTTAMTEALVRALDH